MACPGLAYLLLDWITGLLGSRNEGMAVDSRLLDRYAYTKTCKLYGCAKQQKFISVHKDDVVILSNVQFLNQSPRPDFVLLSYDLYRVAWLPQDSRRRIATKTQARGGGQQKDKPDQTQDVKSRQFRQICAVL